LMNFGPQMAEVCPTVRNRLLAISRFLIIQKRKKLNYDGLRVTSLASMQEEISCRAFWRWAIVESRSDA